MVIQFNEWMNIEAQSVVFLGGGGGVETFHKATNHGIVRLERRSIARKRKFFGKRCEQLFAFLTNFCVKEQKGDKTCQAACAFARWRHELSKCSCASVATNYTLRALVPVKALKQNDTSYRGRSARVNKCAVKL